MRSNEYRNELLVRVYLRSGLLFREALRCVVTKHEYSNEQTEPRRMGMNVLATRILSEIASDLRAAVSINRRSMRRLSSFSQ
ncbi:hypothetical protein NPIL_691981 [Nephila pilipes]|uniref:Uncharacterized protein n=1 Tax=Nephila pilipes TaxID=299642 RepID=A0A8X6P0B7_NEPPI|nr:hypothetical protein NPIL_691981 [Nephila pilipes]